MTITVNIVEGEYDDDLYEPFKKDYLEDKLSVTDIKSKYDFSNAKYRKFQKRVTEETGFSRRNKNTREYYVYETDWGGYTLKKMKDGEVEFTKSFKEKGALNSAVKWLKKHNWDIEGYNRVLHGEEYPRNYHWYAGAWRITKHINGNHVYFGSVYDEDTVKDAVKWLREHDWDRILFDEVKEEKWGIKEPVYKEFIYQIRDDEWLISRKGITYGSYNKTTAKRIARWLRKHNWNKALFEQEKEELIRRYSE